MKTINDKKLVNRKDTIKKLNTSKKSTPTLHKLSYETSRPYHKDYTRRNELVSIFFKHTNSLNKEAHFRLRNNHSGLVFKLAETCHYKILEHYDKWKKVENFWFPYCNGGIMALGKLGTERTAANHRKRLINTGIIIEEIDTGHGFKALVNPLFYLNVDNSEKAVKMFVEKLKEYREAEKENPSYLALNAVMVEHFSPKEEADKYIHYIEEVDKSTKRNLVDNSSFEEIKGVAPRPSLGRKTEQKSPGKSPAVKAENQASQPLITARKKQKKEGRRGGAAAAAADFLLIKQLIIQFWQYAQPKLYPSYIRMSEESTNKVLNTLYFQLFRLKTHTHFKPSDWHNHYLECIERVDIAADWLSRRSETFEMPDPNIYFGESSKIPHIARTEMRFSKTQKWYYERKLNREFSKMANELLAYKRGKGRHKDLSPFQLDERMRKRAYRLDGPNGKYLLNKYLTLAKTIYLKRNA